MTGNLYVKTLHDLRGQCVAWSLGLALLGAINVLLYPTVQQMTGLIAFLDSMPPAFKAMIGDVQAMAQLEGFLRAKLFDPLPLLLAIFAVSQGAQLIAGEVELKSIDLLLARPIPRWRVVLEKLLALITAIGVMTGLLALSLMFCTRFVETDVTAGYLLLSTFNALPLTWVFGAAALLASCLLPRARQAALLAGGIVVASYVFETLRLLSPTLKRFETLSLFAHQKAGFTLAGVMHPGPILLLLGTGGMLALAAVLAFQRRDLVAS